MELVEGTLVGLGHGATSPVVMRGHGRGELLIRELGS
jgi:hypothetical protein